MDLAQDPYTWLVARRRDVRVFHPDVESTKKPYETQYADFRTISGVRSPFLQSQVDLETGDIKQVVAIKKMTYNSDLTRDVMSRTYRPA